MLNLDDYKGTAGHQVLRFADGGLPELMRWLDSQPLRSSGGPSESPSDFNGYTTWADVQEMAIRGWSEGAAQIARGFPPPTFGAASRKPKWGFDVAGDLPDVGRYLSGHPDAMRRRKQERGRQPVAVLYIANGVRANISATEYRNFGQAVCEMIDALENSGTRVELNQLTRAFSHSRNFPGAGFIVTGWRVKDATDHLDLSTVAFTYMHPAAHRRLQFQMRLCNGFDVGGSTYIDRHDFPDAPENAIIIEGVSESRSACRTMDGAREFLRGRINRAAGHELITAEMLEHLTAA